MTWYRFHDVTMEVQPEESEARANLARLWANLSWVRVEGVERNLSCHLSIHLHSGEWNVPPQATLTFQVDGFSGLEYGDGFYLTDGASVFHLQLARGRGDAYLASSFFEKSVTLQANFWSFGLLKLLRQFGFFSLHTAGLVTPNEKGMLVIGPPGSGKSTLTLGLIRGGWSYLSDDAVLLRGELRGVSALALRQHFYIDADAAPRYSDLRLGEEVADSSGGIRRRVFLEDAYPAQQADGCVPELLLLTSIVPGERSSLLPLNHTMALKRLLAASGPQLFDRRTMGRHVDVLKSLLRQAASFELRAGLDLYRNPALLIDMLSKAGSKEITWRAS